MEEWYLLKYLNNMKNNNIRLNLLVVITYILVGCTPQLTIIPDKLNDATLGHPYYAEIKIQGGSGPVSSGSFDYLIKPENSGLELDFFDPQNTPVEFNHFIVKGIPTTLEDISIYIKGATIVSIPWHSSIEFDKTYVVKVREIRSFSN